MLYIDSNILLTGTLLVKQLVNIEDFENFKELLKQNYKGKYKMVFEYPSDAFDTTNYDSNTFTMKLDGYMLKDNPKKSISCQLKTINKTTDKLFFNAFLVSVSLFYKNNLGAKTRQLK